MSTSSERQRAPDRNDRTIRRAAPAKVNLCLHVLARRADGYHEIESLATFASVADEVEIKPAAQWSLSVEGEFAGRVPHGPDNLVLRAGRALAKPGGGQAAHIRLIKNLPVAAGLGGGSSDAASVLTGLAQLWGLARSEVEAVGRQIGADLTFCLQDQAAVVTGIGERLTAIDDFEPLDAVLANCGRPLETASVFRAFRGPFSAPCSVDGQSRGRDWRNDLEATAIALEPEVARCLSLLRQLVPRGTVRMSGSGATCFAIAENAAFARDVAAHLGAREPTWWVRAVRIGQRSVASP
jgi:4-diphosphocytidyl-2-C-methyl-D-erythritol kinase